MRLSEKKKRLNAKKPQEESRATWKAFLARKVANFFKVSKYIYIYMFINTSRSAKDLFIENNARNQRSNTNLKVY